MAKISLKSKINRFAGKTLGVMFCRYRKHKRLPLIKKHASKLLDLKRMMEKIEGVAGDIVECGVWRGRTLLLLSYLAQGRKVWGFDSFKGFPKNKKFPMHFQDTSAEEVKQTLKEGDSPSEVEIVPGFFEDTLLEFKTKIAFLHIDVDLYDSHMTCLKYLYPQVVSGGIILFDEYDEPEWPEAKIAVDEFVKNNHLELFCDNLTGKRYLIKK